MFTFKPKKVFEKLNKMDRKQAYTIGAIAVVSIVALLMLISAATGNKDESFEGMATRGYDLANMPFATDEAEKYLLAAKYPDMQENGSTLLYSAEEKEARQEEDAQAAEENMGNEEFVSEYDDNTSAPRSDNGGYAGYSGSGRGRTKTEIGQLSSTGVATAGGNGVNSTWGPSGDFRQFKNREDRGNGAPAQLKTGNARQALAQFRQGSRAAATFKENRMTGARKALMGGNVAGSDAITKDGVDMSKMREGGLTLDTSAPPSSTDLDNIDKKVAEAAKKAEQKKAEEEIPWWMKMLQNLAEQALSSLVGSVMEGVGDSIKGTIAGNKARNAVYRADSDKHYANLTDDDVKVMTDGKYKTAAEYRQKNSSKKFYNDYGKTFAKEDAVVVGNANSAYQTADTKAQNESAKLREARVGENKPVMQGAPPLCSDGKTHKSWNAEKQNWNDC